MFTMKRKELESALKIAIRCAGLKSSVPALQCCKVEALEDGIRISATDLEVGATVCIAALSGGSSKGSALINASQLASMVSAARSEEEISVELEGGVIKVGSTRIKAPCAVEDYPEFPSMPKKGALSYIPAADFPYALRFVAPAVSKEAVRYALTGVNFDFQRGVVVGTDGKRMHVATLGEPAKITSLILPPRIFTAIQPEEFIIPPATAQEKGGEKEIAMAFLKFSNGIAFTRTIEGKFPDYTGVIPKECPTRVEVEREPLVEGLKNMLSLASAKSPRCKLIANGTVDLLLSDKESGVESSASLECKLKGEGATTHVNPHYLYDCLAGLHGELVHLYFQKRNQAILIEDPETRWFGLVMPLEVEEDSKPSGKRSEGETAHGQSS